MQKKTSGERGRTGSPPPELLSEKTRKKKGIVHPHGERPPGKSQKQPFFDPRTDPKLPVWSTLGWKRMGDATAGQCTSARRVARGGRDLKKPVPKLGGFFWLDKFFSPKKKEKTGDTKKTRGDSLW